ncbi:hypothetical protein [Saccharospirillum alexandrii]|uniref:hypothetical protein n=1 Tax=Saccharospirillum alexandrii TaxID=2448477 RepID=UPI003737064F
MKVISLSIIIIGMALASGCTALQPKSTAEKLSGYTYIPVDPFAVRTNPGNACGDIDITTLAKSVDVGQVRYKDLLEALPDNAVRVSIQQYSASGQVSYGVGSINSEADSYKLTVDYINTDTVNVKFWLTKYAIEQDSQKIVSVPMSVSTDNSNFIPGSITFDVQRIGVGEPVAPTDKSEEFNLPVYIGVGLRVTAVIESFEGASSITGLGSLATEAEASGLNGFLVTQTLGINGQGIAAALPIQSELNPTTAQNAIVAVGSIKSLLYEDGTIVAPRVVGLYLPFPGGEPLVNAILSELSKERVIWERPCVVDVDRS